MRQLTVACGALEALLVELLVQRFDHHVFANDGLLATCSHHRQHRTPVSTVRATQTANEEDVMRCHAIRKRTGAADGEQGFVVRGAVHIVVLEEEIGALQLQNTETSKAVSGCHESTASTKQIGYRFEAVRAEEAVDVPARIQRLTSEMHKRG